MRPFDIPIPLLMLALVALHVCRHIERDPSFSGTVSRIALFSFRGFDQKRLPYGFAPILRLEMWHTPS
jgi:hypothetical protein